MKLTAVFEPAKEGGYTCFVEEIPAAISQGETLAEAKANLLDALKLVLECQRYAYEFYEWKKQYVLKKHWLAHTKRTCPRCKIPFSKSHLGRTQRRSFWCENCQLQY